MKRILQVASALALSAGVLASANVSAQTHAPIKNIVLVHGAWVDGSGWKPVYDILTRDGYHVTMVQEPLTSLDADVAATKRVLDLQNSPTILVGHSYGGSVITEAGVHPNVAGLVYVAAHAPNVGEDEGALGKKTPSFLAKQTNAVEKTADGYTYLNPAVFPKDFAADLPLRQATFESRSQILTAAQVFHDAALRRGVDDETELGHRGGRRQDHQSGSRTLVLRTRAQSHHGHSGREPFRVRIEAAAGRGRDRRCREACGAVGENRAASCSTHDAAQYSSGVCASCRIRRPWLI